MTEVARAQKLGNREERRLKRKQRAALQIPDQGMQEQDVGEVKGKRLKQRKRKLDHEGNGKPHQDDSWKVSDAVGGHLLNIEPIFSPDENHLLLTYESILVVYSVSTSLAVRHLRTKDSSSISAFALSVRKAHELYISTYRGAIEKWDWQKGLRIGYWKLSSSIHFLTTSVRTTEEDDNDLVYTVDKKDTGPWLISAHRLKSGSEASETGVKTLFSHRRALSYVKVSEGGRYIVAASGPQLIIGNTESPDLTILQDLSYTWRIVDCPEWITSVDVRISHAETKIKKSKAGKKMIAYLAISVGDLKGSIHIYENLLGALLKREQPMSKESHGDVVSRRLHWHRNAVLALKWSLDGESDVSTISYDLLIA